MLHVLREKYLSEVLSLLVLHQAFVVICDYLHDKIETSIGCFFFLKKRVFNRFGNILAQNEHSQVCLIQPVLICQQKVLEIVNL